MQVASSSTKFLEIFDTIPCDTTSIPQERLNLINKFRTSIFPWRGQFSPELIELFLDRYSNENSVVLDPFVGSGTTLFEASSKGLECYGIEINPSALEMAKTIYFANISDSDRKGIIDRAESLAEQYVRPFTHNLFTYLETEQYEPQESDNSVERLLGTLLAEVGNESHVNNILVNAIIRYMSYSASRVKGDFIRALQEQIKVIKNISYNKKKCTVFHTDARTIPLSNKTINLIITSPPYINVFNYHQNNRKAMEVLGWDILNIAKSEIGANRKHRQNRFLTVIQYSLDMLDALKEMRRLLTSDGRAIIVVGKESNVRGLSFQNGALVAALAVGGASFQLEMRQERSFKNKFGETIYEDILHLVPDTTAEFKNDVFARSLASQLLLQAAEKAEGEVRDEILDAEKHADSVQKSPLFKLPVVRQKLGMLKEINEPYQEETTMKTYPTPHLEKLKATLENDKLPADDRHQVEMAIGHYEQWIANMDAVMREEIAVDQQLQKMVDLLNQYRIRMDIDLIFDSRHDWLYRQKGQIKLDNSVIEEFLPRLVYSPLISEIMEMNVTVGPVKAFSSIWFDSSLIKSDVAGGLSVRTKDQDFVISRPLYLKASHSPNFDKSVEEFTQLAYVAAECKTNLDKTMFQEACATARDLKTAIPSAKYFLLCEWLDMKPVSSRTTPIDEVLVLREAKRINSDVRRDFSTFAGRQKARDAYIRLLNENPCRVKVFKRFLDYIRQLLDNEPLNKETVLERGYF